MNKYLKTGNNKPSTDGWAGKPSIIGSSDNGACFSISLKTQKTTINGNEITGVLGGG